MKNLPQRAVDVSVIEHELKELWEQMTEVTAEEDQQAVMRACVANLVVYNPAGESAGEISPMIAEVTNQHPSRVILLLSEPDSSQASLAPWSQPSVILPGAAGSKFVVSKLLSKRPGRTSAACPVWSEPW